MGILGSAWNTVKSGAKAAVSIPWALTGNADQEKAAAQHGADSVRNLGDNVAGMYETAGNKALDRFARAGGIAQDFQTKQPTYVQDYAKSYKGAPTQVRDWYGQYNPTSTVGNRYNQVQQLGYGADPLGDRYRSSGAQNPSNLQQNLGNLQNYAGGYGQSQRLGQNLAAGYASPDALDRRVGELRDLGGVPTQTSTALANIQLMNPTLRTDAALRGVMGANPDRYTGYLADSIKNGESAGARALSDFERGNTDSQRLRSSLASGQGDTAQLLGEMRSGGSPTAALQQTLANGGGATGRFMNQFDPGREGALHSTYGKLSAEGPTYEEDFYTSLLAGDNPAYEQLKKDFLRTSQNSAAARGGFTSGQALEQERAGLSRLAADEFANRGALAGQAGAARRARLGQELEGAGALESNILGRQSLAGNLAGNTDSLVAGLAEQREGNMTTLAGQREGRIADLAQFGDATRAGLAGDQDALLGNLATSRDQFGYQNRALEAQLAQSGDAQGLNLARLGLEGAGQEDNLGLARQGQLNDLITTGTSRDISRGNTLASLAGQSDLDQRARQDLLYGTLGQADSQTAQERARMDSLAGQYDASIMNRGQATDRLAGAASDEYMSGQQLGLQGAGAASGEQQTGDQFGFDLARGASSESIDNLKTNFDQALRLGDSEAAIQSAYDMARIGAFTESQLSALRLELEKAGYDRQAQQQLLDNIISFANLGAKYSGKTGGK